ncbi:Plasmid recombination enzyme [Oribacterium sp. KHPX15]|uniref:MobV family relaxase n=1 Tax=Oribacterium sp. KHPX15 TaxID=1855342 RepID=UPI00089BC44A|nr:MobV family relaxase [Oribacterium sp. KHPX15]SEA92497.1 Plasmid recombination enzyme [Oribacterium sp. KHPX15]
MSIAKGTFNIEFIHSKKELQRAYKHNYRHEGFYACNVDKDSSYLNEQLIGSSEETYEKAFQRRIGESGYYDTHKIHKNAVMGISLCMELGDGDLPKGFKYDEWKKKNIDFLCKEFSKENVVSAVLHMDEGKPHIHALVIPISNGKLSSRSYLPTRSSLIELHNRYYQDCSKDLDLSPENSGVFAQHKDVKRFLYTPLDNVAKECLCKPEPQETMEEYYERANEDYKDLKFSDFKKSQKIRFLAEENELLRKANHRAKEEIKEELKKEIVKETGCKTYEQYLDRTRAYVELKRGLNFIDITDSERAKEIKQVIKEVFDKAQKVDKIYSLEDQELGDNTYRPIDSENFNRYMEDFEEDDYEDIFV